MQIEQPLSCLVLSCRGVALSCLVLSCLVAALRCMALCSSAVSASGRLPGVVLLLWLFRAVALHKESREEDQHRDLNVYIYITHWKTKQKRYRVTNLMVSYGYPEPVLVSPAQTMRLSSSHVNAREGEGVVVGKDTECKTHHVGDLVARTKRAKRTRLVQFACEKR